MTTTRQNPWFGSKNTGYLIIITIIYDLLIDYVKVRF
jgi:hypothetical protein